MNRRGVSLALLLFIQSASCTATRTDEEDADPYQQTVDAQLADLVKHYSAFPRNGARQESVAAVKTAVASLLESADTDQKQRILAKAICETFKQTKRYRLFEYYLLWKSRGQLLVLAEDKSVLPAIIAKIESRKAITDNAEIANHFADMAISALQTAVEYPEGTITLENGEARWHKFRDWLRSNHARMQFDRDKQKFVLPD